MTQGSNGTALSAPAVATVVVVVATTDVIAADELVFDDWLFDALLLVELNVWDGEEVGGRLTLMGARDFVLLSSFVLPFELWFGRW